MKSLNKFLEVIRTRAHEGSLRKILFPESMDERVLEAARILRREKLADPVFVTIEEKRALELEKLLLEIRASKAGTKDELSREKARELAHDPLFYGMFLLRKEGADGLVAGASHTTADVVRAGLWLVEKAEGVQTVSSSMYMMTPPFHGEDESVVTFADCAVVQRPTAEQLADIAIASADARLRIVGDEPRVAMLSYSTKGSGSGPSVDLVREAVGHILERRPDIIVEGEIQSDAALVESIYRRKVHAGKLGGRANVLIFPSLDAGNIAYKLVLAFAPGVVALGPILQGLKKPVSDLSRGATVDDIVHIATIVAVQAKHE